MKILRHSNGKAVVISIENVEDFTKVRNGLPYTHTGI